MLLPKSESGRALKPETHMKKNLEPQKKSLVLRRIPKLVPSDSSEERVPILIIPFHSFKSPCQ